MAIAGCCRYPRAVSSCYEDEQFTGEMHNLCYEEDNPFGGLTESIHPADGLHDGCPQADTILRSYEEKDQKQATQYDHYRNKDFLNATMKRSPQR